MASTGSLAKAVQRGEHFVVMPTKWACGWDLHIDGAGLNSGGGVTLVTSLEHAEDQVREY